MDELTQEEADKQAKLFGLALTNYALGNLGAAFDYLQELIDRCNLISGMGDVTLMFLLAHYIVNTDPNRDEDKFTAFVTVKDGSIVDNPDEAFPDGTSQEAAATWCMRFITATANKDQPQQHALLNATDSEKTVLGRMRLLIHMAGEVMKTELKREWKF